MAEGSDKHFNERIASLSSASSFSAENLAGPEQEEKQYGGAGSSINPTATHGSGYALMDTISSGISSTRRALGLMLSSAVEQIHNIEQQPADQMHFGEMHSNVGQIRLHPDPAAALATGAVREASNTLDALESGAGSEAQQRRPGLMSQYLRLMVLDRKQNRKTQRDRQHTSSGEAAHTSEQHDDEGMWEDDSRQSTPRRSAANLRRRRSKLRLGFKSLQSSQRNSPTATPVTHSLADTSGTPFRHLSEALPWAATQRHLASASTCGTPVAHTRRPSVSSITGDVTTMPRVTMDTNSIEESIARLRQLDSSKRADKPGKTIEQQSILHAIDLLLLHQRFLVLIAKALM
ncbi:hypothetical protein IWW50_000320, partial [Coemansia erecta]